MLAATVWRDSLVAPPPRDFQHSADDARQLCVEEGVHVYHDMQLRRGEVLHVWRAIVILTPSILWPL